MTIPDLSQNNEAVDGFLSSFVVPGEDDAQQHGVKGQKWGVRKDSPAGGAKTTAVKEAVRRATGAALGINNNPRYKGKDLTKDPALKMQYDRDVKHAFKHELKVVAARTAVVAGVAAVAPAFPAAFTAVAAIAAHRIITTSTSSRIITGDFGVPSDAASSTFFMDSGLQHAAITGRTTYVLTADRDAKGFITKLFADELVVAHADDSIDSVLEHAVKLGTKKGKPGHILFIARGSAPKVGSQFNHQGAPHQVIKVDTSSSDPKRHMVTAKKVDAKAVAHADLDEWETYLIEDDEDADYFEHHGVKGQKWGVRKDQLGLTAITAGASKGDGGAVSVGQRNDPKNPAPQPSKKDAANLAKATTQARDGALGKQSLDRIDALNKAVLKDLDAKKYEWNDAAQKSYEKHVAVHMEEGAKANIKVKGVTAWCRPLGDNTFMLHVGHADAIAAFQKDHNLAHAQMTGVSSVHITAQRDAKGLVTGLTAGATVLEHSELVGEIIASAVDAQQHGIKGMKWGVRRSVDSATGRVEMTGSTGLNPRRGSADQIAQDRIQKKIDSVGVHALSTAELQSYSRRLQVEKDVNRVLAEQSAAQKAASQSFITKFVKKQAGRQTNRVIDKALDVAVEKALHEAGIKIGKKGGNPDAADLLVKTATRLAPKKGK